MSDEQTQTTDDPSGPGWAWVAKGDTVREGDTRSNGPQEWYPTEAVGQPVHYNNQYRRRIEQPQPSDSETETIEDLRRQLAACEMLLAEAGGSGEQVNAELQQLREQVATLTQALKTERDGMIGSLRSQNRLGQEAAVELIEAWLKPVVELMAEQPEDHAELAIVILGYLPQIAGRLIEEEP